MILVGDNHSSIKSSQDPQSGPASNFLVMVKACAVVYSENRASNAVRLLEELGLDRYENDLSEQFDSIDDVVELIRES